MNKWEEKDLFGPILAFSAYESKIKLVKYMLSIISERSHRVFVIKPLKSPKIC